MKYIDIKVTVWNRMVLEDNTNIEQIIADIKTKGINHVINDVREWKDVLTLWDSEEILTPDDNDQCATLQIWDDNDLVWDNEININNTENY
jgi:hypothetical protein